MVSLNDLMSLREQILRLAESHGAGNVRVFGSVARGEMVASSDVDILVRMSPDRSLIDRIALIHDLEDMLHSSVDVVNERILHPEIRDSVLAEAIEL